MHADGAYWAGLVDVYGGAADAWTAYADGDAAGGLALMSAAADADDAREKHILLENKLFPMRELYGDLLLMAGHPAEAMAAFRTSEAAAPNRFNGVLGSARAAHALGREDEARQDYAKAAALVVDASPGRPEIAEVRHAGIPPSP